VSTEGESRGAHAPSRAAFGALANGIFGVIAGERKKFASARAMKDIQRIGLYIIGWEIQLTRHR